MKTIQGNLLDIQRGILVHQVNTLGVMGAGLALQIRQKWPIVHDRYIQSIRKGKLILGFLQCVKVEDGLWVANLAGQETCGGKATVYEAYHKALPDLVEFATRNNLSIYFPKGIGCGLAGGDWNVMLPILEQYCPEATLVDFKN